MDLSSLNVDVLLYLMEFVEPVDRFNLVLSGILKGFENANEGIDLHERIEVIGIELGLRRGGMCEWEIRSLWFYCLINDSLYKILERLAEKGYLQNTQFEGHEYDLLKTPSFVKVICSMKNLEKLTLDACHLKLEDLASVFQSCSKFIELNIESFECKTLEMAEHLKNQLRPGFQRLRRFNLSSFIDDSVWPMILEMLTWLKECVNLTIKNFSTEEEVASLVIDDSLTLDPNLTQNLQILTLEHLPAVIVEWVLPVCLNIHCLKIDFSEQSNGLHNEIARLNKLKELEVSAYKARELKEIFRSCRQVEILRMHISDLTLGDLAELEPAENLTDITLHWGKGPTLKEVLPVLKRWTQLRRLTLQNNQNISGRPFELLSEFIMEMKNLSHLHIDIRYSNHGQLKVLRDKVNEFLLPLRPNFKLVISRIY